MPSFFRAGIPFVCVLFLFQTSVYSQDINPLNVGSRVPQHFYDILVQNSNGSIKKNDLTGKLIILNFWRISCATCIEEFPHLQDLQKEFGNKIAIVFVTRDSRTQIDRLFSRLYKNKIIPDFPAITGDSVLEKYFPHSFAGHYVWIDAGGTVCVRGIAQNNTRKKIALVLQGSPVSYISEMNSGKLNSEKDKHIVLRKTVPNNIRPLAGSVFSGFSDVSGDPYGEAFLQVTDSSNQTISTVIVNSTILELYKTAFLPQLQDSWLAIVNDYGVNGIADKRIQIEVKDSARISWLYLSQESYTDEWMRQNQFCYEQLLPAADSGNWQHYMQQDLNRFIGGLQGIFARIGERKMKCLSIVRTAAIDKLKSAGQHYNSEEYTVGGEHFRKVSCDDLRSVLYSMSIDIDSGLLLVDETGYTEKVDMIYRTGIRSMDEFKRALNKYGMDLVERDRIMKVLIISDRH